MQPNIPGANPSYVLLHPKKRKKEKTRRRKRKENTQKKKENKRKKAKQTSALRARAEFRGDKVGVCWYYQSCDVSSSWTNMRTTQKKKKRKEK